MADDKAASTSAVLDQILARLASLEAAVRETRSLVGPFGVPMPEGRMLVQSLHGIKYCIDPGDMIMAPQLIIYRQWEADLSKFVAEFVSRDTVFVDVGANFGYFTCLAATKIGVGGRGRVFAFEPNPDMLALLRCNIGINWSQCPVAVHGVAASDRSGFVEFCVPKGRAANASIRPVEASGDLASIIVKAETVDSIVHDAIDLMKVDVEGFELFVLNGARETIKRSPDIAIIMEWSLSQMKAAGTSGREMVTLCRDLALVPHRVPPTGRIAPSQWKDYELNVDAVLATPYENVIWRRSASV